MKKEPRKILRQLCWDGSLALHINDGSTVGYPFSEFCHQGDIRVLAHTFHHVHSANYDYIVMKVKDYHA